MFRVIYEILHYLFLKQGKLNIGLEIVDFLSLKPENKLKIKESLTYINRDKKQKIKFY